MREKKIETRYLGRTMGYLEANRGKCCPGCTVGKLGEYRRIPGELVAARAQGLRQYSTDTLPHWRKRKKDQLIAPSAFYQFHSLPPCSLLFYLWGSQKKKEQTFGYVNALPSLLNAANVFVLDLGGLPSVNNSLSPNLNSFAAEPSIEGDGNSVTASTHFLADTSLIYQPCRRPLCPSAWR